MRVGLMVAAAACVVAVPAQAEIKSVSFKLPSDVRRSIEIRYDGLVNVFLTSLYIYDAKPGATVGLPGIENTVGADGTFTLTAPVRLNTKPYGYLSSSIRVGEGGYFSSQFRSTGFTITGDTNVAPVPEPVTWALMILGFGAVGGAMRRRQSVAAKVRFA